MNDESPAERTMSLESYIPPVEEGAPARLSTQDAAAVDALQAGDALLIVHHGPNLGARFLFAPDSLCLACVFPLETSPR